MLNSKQRAFLRSKANTLDPIMQVGKGEITEEMLSAISKALMNRELIKISVLQNSDYEARQVADIIAEELHADIVSVVGRKIVVYRKSTKQGVSHIEIPESKK